MTRATPGNGPTRTARGYGAGRHDQGGFEIATRVGTTTDTGTPLPQITDPQKIAPQDARTLPQLFLERLALLEEGTAEYQYARNTLIEMNMSLVRYAAGRFRSGNGQTMEDVVQV